jgi:membrane protein DedA with SNARE-associated domain/membrane-associated phospholipid phosphatase
MGGLFMNAIIQLLNQYGYIILFLSLMLELIIVPVPNEALMSYVGVLCFQGKMNIYISIISAGLGGVLGVTISYWIGYKLGAPFFRKFGHYIHMGPEKLEKMSKWYERYGKVLLLVSFFVPGVRHIASIISGVIKLPFRYFWIFSYIGVFLWVGTFISLGNVLGPKWDQYQGEIKKWLVLASIVIGIIAIIYFVIKANKEYIKESFLLLHEAAFKRFRSFFKIKFIILFILALFISFSTLMVGMIQDLISNEFGHFNIITKTIVFSVFNAHWKWLMDASFFLSSWTALGLISLVTVIVILMNKTNKWLELIFFVSTLAGSFLFSKGIRWLFHFMLNSQKISSDFPNEQTMLVLSVYGFFFIMFIRHKKRLLLSTFMFVLFLLLLLAYFISGIYLHHLNPSDLVAGYIFSAVWTTGMVLSLEMFRLLSIIKANIKVG